VTATAALRRFSPTAPCPICGGHQRLPRGGGRRCAGFASDDGEWVRCTREERAGALDLDERTVPPTYLHKMTGPCHCGTEHGPSASRRPPVRERRYSIRDEAGEAVAVHVRRDGPDGKTFAWLQPDGTVGLNGTPVTALPLYVPESTSLADLPDGAPVFVVEGERTADALASVGLAAAATVTGASSCPGDAALRPLVRLSPTVWPDADAAGAEHAARLVVALRRLGADPHLVEPPAGVPKGWDAADLIAQHWPNRAAARTAIESLSAHTALFAPSEEAWPELDPAALHGLAGEVVAAIDPHTESDSTAILASFLVAFGNAIGAAPHVVVGATLHPGRLFAALVGETSRARKGDSWSAVRRLMARAAPEWTEARVQGGLSSGEGLIAAVRDPLTQLDRKTGEILTVEAGVDDKRLLTVEPELGRTLRVMRRDGSTLSAILRDCWDTGSLRVMTKTQLRATGAHVSVLGHITEEELRRELDDTSLANGFANRFLWLAARRSKRLPEPEPLDGPTVDRLAAKIAEAVRFAHGRGAVPRDDEARGVWAEVYGDLTADLPGMLGAVLSRCEAHAVRLALLYALLDQSPVVRREHLEAALAVIDYAEASARHIFGDRLGDPVADAIVAALAGRELTRNAIRDHFGRHVSASRISAALDALSAAGKVAMEKRETGGRPVEVWRRAR
jgi:hypothetical protein